MIHERISTGRSIATSSLILIVHPSVPVRSVRDLIALALNQPGKLNYASGGAGSPTHLAPALLASMAGIKINHVPYKGTGPAITDLLGGHVTMAFSSLPSAIGVVRDGKVRALAVTGAIPSTVFPNVPTVAESGLPGYEAAQRYGIIAPARTPRVIIDKLNTALREALASAGSQGSHRSRRRNAPAGDAGGLRSRYRSGGSEVVESNKGNGIQL